MKSDKSHAFAMLWKMAGNSDIQPVREHRFHPERKWRFDSAFPEHGVAVEVEGVVWRGKSRHTTTQGYTNDLEKYNAATLLGWKVLRFTQFDIEKNPGYVIDCVRMALGLDVQNASQSK